MIDDMDFFLKGREIKNKPLSATNKETTIAGKKDEKNNQEVIFENQIDDAKIKSESQEDKKRYKAQDKPTIKRVFDNYVQKRTQLNEEDYLFLTSVEKSISFARKRLNVASHENRITANTLIRLAIEDFTRKLDAGLENNKKLIEKLQDEESIREWIKTLH